MIGGVPASILFSGLAATFVGLYQINVQVPAAVPFGDTASLIVSIGGAVANTVTIGRAAWTIRGPDYCQSCAP